MSTAIAIVLAATLIGAICITWPICGMILGISAFICMAISTTQAKNQP